MKYSNDSDWVISMDRHFTYNDDNNRQVLEYNARDDNEVTIYAMANAYGPRAWR